MRMAVEILERQTPELCLDVTAHCEHRELGNPGHEVALHPAEGRTEEVEQRDHAEDHPELREVDAFSRGTFMPERS
jgi:hypothetical protein